MNASSRRASRLRQGILAVAAMVLSTGLVACGSSGSTSTSTAAGSAGASGAASAGASAEATWPVTIKGDDGVDVEIKAEPKSIVSTSVTLTGSLLAIDAPVVASTPAKKKDEKTDDNGFFTQWSKQATDKGVKAIDGTEDNLAQTVAGDNPDLIIVAKTGQDSAVKVVESLRQLEVPVLVIDYGSHSWQDVTKTLGQATGRQGRLRRQGLHHQGGEGQGRQRRPAGGDVGLHGPRGRHQGRQRLHRGGPAGPAPQGPGLHHRHRPRQRQG